MQIMFGIDFQLSEHRSPLPVSISAMHYILYTLVIGQLGIWHTGTELVDDNADDD